MSNQEHAKIYKIYEKNDIVIYIRNKRDHLQKGWLKKVKKIIKQIS